MKYLTTGLFQLNSVLNNLKLTVYVCLLLRYAEELEQHLGCLLDT